jgi:hypothetical protein
MLYAWLDAVHMRAKQRGEKREREKREGEKREGDGGGPQGLTPHLQEIILSYCLRVIDQSKLKPPNDSSPSPLANDLLPITALSEAIRYSIL